MSGTPRLKKISSAAAGTIPQLLSPSIRFQQVHFQLSAILPFPGYWLLDSEVLFGSFLCPLKRTPHSEASAAAGPAPSPTASAPRGCPDSNFGFVGLRVGVPRGMMGNQPCQRSFTAPESGMAVGDHSEQCAQ